MGFQLFQNIHKPACTRIGFFGSTTLTGINAFDVSSFMNQHCRAVVCFRWRFLMYGVSINFHYHDDAVFQYDKIGLNASVCLTSSDKHWKWGERDPHRLKSTVQVNFGWRSEK